MSKSDRRIGILCVVSGPSGSGKTTLCRAARERADCRYSVSCTTRAPRGKEVDGEHYHFLSVDEFQAKVEAGEFLEHAIVHGNHYGTLRSSVEDLLKEGHDVVMDIDVQGAELVRACEEPLIKQCLVDVFILPPSMDELKKRLSGRGTESDDEFQLRMNNALEEMAQWEEYAYLILSGTIEKDFDSFVSILKAERQRGSRLSPQIAKDLAARQ